MNIASQKRIEWDEILEAYGPEAKIAITRLLADAQISDTDPAAVIIAALFISQIDSTKAFQSISETIDKGKEQLTVQFRGQIEQLRGVVTYAEEHLVQSNEERVEKHQKELVDAVKGGIAKVLGKEQQNRHKRANFKNGATIICTAIVAVVCMVTGASTALLARGGEKVAPVPVSADNIKALPNGERWLEIAESNQTQLKTCLENVSTLDNRCAITIPE
jgi:predicted phage tail protein